MPGVMVGWWLCARVSSHDRRADLDRRVARLTRWATTNGHRVGEVVTGIGSGSSGTRPKIRRVLSDPSATVVVVEHRDRLARFGVQHLEAALSAQGHRIVVTDDGEADDVLVWDIMEVPTWRCARLCGRRGARNQGLREVAATKPVDPVEVGC